MPEFDRKLIASLGEICAEMPKGIDVRRYALRVTNKLSAEQVAALQYMSLVRTSQINVCSSCGSELCDCTPRQNIQVPTLTINFSVLEEKLVQTLSERSIQLSHRTEGQFGDQLTVKNPVGETLDVMLWFLTPLQWDNETVSDSMFHVFFSPRPESAQGKGIDFTTAFLDPEGFGDRVEQLLSPANSMGVKLPFFKGLPIVEVSAAQRGFENYMKRGGYTSHYENAIFGPESRRFHLQEIRVGFVHSNEKILWSAHDDDVVIYRFVNGQPPSDKSPFISAGIEQLGELAEGYRRILRVRTVTSWSQYLPVATGIVSLIVSAFTGLKWVNKTHLKDVVIFIYLLNLIALIYFVVIPNLRASLFKWEIREHYCAFAKVKSALSRNKG